MIIQREVLTDALLDELVPLLEQHWSEVAHYQDIPLNIDRASYLQSEQMGMVRCFVVRDETDHRVVGYALYVVRQAVHYQQSKQAVQDVVYLHPSVRGGTGATFLQWCDAALANEGCQVVYHHVKAAHDFSPLLQRMGYALVDTIWARRLDRETESALSAHTTTVRGLTTNQCT